MGINARIDESGQHCTYAELCMVLYRSSIQHFFPLQFCKMKVYARFIRQGEDIYTAS